MGQPDKKRIEQPLNDLVEVIQKLSESAKDRLEAYRELVEYEWITEEMFKRMIHNERLGLIEEIDNILDYYRGMQ